MSEPVVIVGGDATEMSAASKCKRDDPDREVIVFEKGEVESLEDLVSVSALTR